MALTKAQLDPAGCDIPDCGHDHSILYFHARCHRGSAVEVCYEKATGQMVVTCTRCKREVARVEVAS